MGLKMTLHGSDIALNPISLYIFEQLVAATHTPKMAL
jgi:hypothetical protein